MIQQAIATCRHGVHRPKRPCTHVAETLRRAVCRDCGAPLFQTNVSRKWVLSGTLA